MAGRTNKGRESTSRPSKKKKTKKRMGFGLLLAWTLVAAIFAAVCALGLYIFIIIQGNTILNQNIDKLDLDEATVIYDSAGTEIGKFKTQGGNRDIVTAAEIPDLVKNAFIATEDKRFNEHAGIDFLGIGRALVKDIMARSMVEGGSTITQQLAKNLFLNADKTFFRKATEMSIAVALEERFDKDKILELYLNRIYFGKGVYGIKAASKYYFDQSDLNKLELWQAATLAAMPKAPNSYNPINSPEKSLERRAVVLRLMTDQGYISEKERADAAAVEYVSPKQDETEQANQAYIDYVLREAQEKYGMDEDDLMRNGYQIYTAIDLKAQQAMNAAYANDKFFQKDGPEQKMQSSMIILNNTDGGIVAMAGGREYVARGLNWATDPRAARQPGSAFKPLISFAPAVEKFDFNPYTLVPDEKRTYNGYSPRNYDGVYRGQVTMLEAVKRSMNAPAVHLLNEVGVVNAIQFVNRLGIELDPKKDNNLAIALGGLTHGVTVMQMAEAYTSFVNGGTPLEAHAITKIVNASGKIVTEFKPEKRQPVMSAKTAWYMTQMLQSVVGPGGTGRSASFERPVAGKTGSTQEVLKGLEKYNRDLWFTGYTPEWTASVWMGFEKPDAKHYVSISSGAPAALFKEVMQKGLAGRKVVSFQKPEGVPDLTTPPKAVTDLTAVTEPGKISVKVSWSAAGSDLTYKLFRRNAGEAAFPEAPIMETQATEVNDISVLPGQTYEYMVVPVNPASRLEGAPSNTAQVTVSAESDPLLPELTDPITGLPILPGGEGEGDSSEGNGNTGDTSGDGSGSPGEGSVNEGNPGDDGAAGPSGEETGQGNGVMNPGNGNGRGSESPRSPGRGNNGGAGSNGGNAGSGTGTDGTSPSGTVNESLEELLLP